MNHDCSLDRHLTSSNQRAKNLKLLLGAAALVALLASSAYPQVLNGTILLPDSLGPLTGVTHVAFDENPSHPRMFIGSEGGDVLVVDARTCQRIARIATGSVGSICYSTRQDKLYATTGAGYSIVVADCGSYRVTKELQFTDYVNGLFYNPVVDRVYCGFSKMKVIDCVADSVVGSLRINAMSDCFALDSSHDVLYVGAPDAIKVVNCNDDSVVASIPELRAPQAVCFQPSASKLYVAAGESLFALSAKTDSVVYRQLYDTLDPQLAVDPVHNRVYYTYWGYVIALDCQRDSTIWTQDLCYRANGLAVVPTRDELHVTEYGMGWPGVQILDGASGRCLHGLDPAFDQEYLPYFCAAASRVFLVADNFEADWVDCDADSIGGGIPLAINGIGVYNTCVDSVHNMLYFCNPGGGPRGYVGVVDCASNKVTSYLTAFEHPSWLTYEPVHNRLYVCSYDSCIFVYDCAADSVIKTIHTDYRTFSMYRHPTLHKLYAVVLGPGPYGSPAQLWVIDPVSDTVVKTLPLRCAPVEGSFLVPELNQLWFFFGHYTVVDCLHDSIVMDTMPPSYCGSSGTCYSPSDRRVYVPTDDGDRAMYVIDMDTRLTVDSIPVPETRSSGVVFGAAQAHKVYWVFEGGPVDSVFVVDTRSDSIVGKLRAPCLTSQTLGDRSGDYVYFFSDTLTVVDTRTDSVVNQVRLPLVPSGVPTGIAKNNATNRFYLSGYSDTIQVVYDSVVLAGLHSISGNPTQAKRPQTLLNRSVSLRSPTDATLFDASGKRVAALRPGANDISHLAPGVYFVREEPQAPSRKPQTVRKVVVTR